MKRKNNALVGAVSTMAFIKCGGFVMYGMLEDSPTLAALGVAFGIFGVFAFLDYTSYLRNSF